ncbi:MAG: methyltransferase domain-containing protein [Proteobacteria bacterium]|nr:methyltransferase domain-containing protein [Pseudomonadota bacterium]MDA1309305.1 methyltransferase domain-containing protein [Pseudomonadota bacterium]
MNQNPTIFDRQLLRARRDRAARSFEKFDFLMIEAADRLADRLLDLSRRFSTVLDLGCHTGGLATVWPAGLEGAKLLHADLSPAMAIRAAAHGPAIACDEEALPFAEGSLDAVLSCLSMHWVNDLPGALVQIRRALRPDGMLLASMLGGDTLVELREVLSAAELEVAGGLSPRVSPFADIPDLGGLLQRAGFALPVVDSDVLTVTYDNLFALMADLRGMGESNVVLERHKMPTRRGVLLRAAEIYQERFAGSDGRIPATFQILTMTGWAPDASQQQPLRPGSAQSRLADALGAVEAPVGEKANPG